MPAPTLRSLSKALHLSRTTISDALRGSPRVKPETVELVVSAAAAAGYRRNPLASIVMSHQRRSRGRDCHPTIAVVDPDPQGRSPRARDFASAVCVGIEARAIEMGYQAERLVLGAHGMTAKDLNAILALRKIQTLIILPVEGAPTGLELNWQRYAAVYADEFIDQPVLHSVCSDHYRSMRVLLGEIYRRGYRRPGLIMEQNPDERRRAYWEEAFLAFHRSHQRNARMAPRLVAPFDERAFRRWFGAWQPDVVIGESVSILEWMHRADARVPEQHGFICLDSVRLPLGSARLDLRPGRIGARAVELVAALQIHNEMGRPEHPSLTTLPACFVDGYTFPPRQHNRREERSSRSRGRGP